MVFFTCQHCGDSLKKAAVENHCRFQCRSQPHLTCVDCLKDFKGKEYVQHTECLTELERYSAKGFVPKANKQQIKQMEWADIVNVVLQTEELYPEQKKLLQVCSNHPNIPRKKPKFLNFMFNTTNRKCNTDIVNSIFDILAAKFKEITKNNSSNKQTNGKSDKLKTNDIITSSKEESTNLQENERSEHEIGLNNTEPEESHTDKKYSKKGKRKNESESNKTVKRKKLHSFSPDEELRPKRFSWSNTITEILENHKDKEIRFNKLCKKVIETYKTLRKEDETDEILLAKFNKKIKKTAGIEIFDNRVKLVA